MVEPMVEPLAFFYSMGNNTVGFPHVCIIGFSAFTAVTGKCRGGSHEGGF